MFIDNVYKKSISYRLYRRFFPKRWQSGLIKSIVYPWVCEDVPYGKSSRPWPMPGPQRARPAGPEQAYPSSEPDRRQNFHLSPLLIWKSLIGRFYWEELKAMGTILMKMAVLLQGHAFCAWTAMDPSGYFFFETHSLIDFQIGKGRKREFRAAELRFSLHKEFCAAEIRFYLYKEFSRGTMWQKMAILQ